MAYRLTTKHKVKSKESLNNSVAEVIKSRVAQETP